VTAQDVVGGAPVALSRVMLTHPVQLRVEPTRIRRVQLVTRLALLAALGALGCSSLYWALYIGLPALAALLVSRDGSDRYLANDAPRIVRALRWLANAYAYLWLLTDLPTAPGAGVTFELVVGGRPTASSALLRLVTSLPAALLLALLSMLGAALWIVAAIAILFTERVPAPLAEFFAAMLRYQFRIVAYHLSLTDAYPTLSAPPLSDAPAATA
jgi:hypothetical protein